MSRLLIVCHCPSPNTTLLAQSVFQGAQESAGDQLEICLRSPFETDPQQVLECAGIILGTTENFGYMNGALKDFFERIYYPCLEQTPGLPYALFIKAGNDGAGARESVERIVKGLRWRAVAEPVLCVGAPDTGTTARFRELGATFGAGLAAGIW